MEVIPVIDLKGGTVVRARMGQRDRYQPIVTPLSPTANPLDVARGLLSLYPFNNLYLADLDAIEGRGDNTAVFHRLTAEFPGLMLWIDNGIADRRIADKWLARGQGRLVIGSETQSDATLAGAYVNHDGVAVSLDFRGPSFQGPSELLVRPEIWPRRIIVMTLERIGGDAGPDLDRISHIQSIAAGREIYAAGGVRGVDDLMKLEQAGVSGALVASCLHDGRLSAADIGRL